MKENNGYLSTGIYAYHSCGLGFDLHLLSQREKRAP